ncbi:hypothetical protein [Bradyrhizobium sp. CCBAU 53415]|nr:hypothetical protein [Bradyrhizobium sp. CCBAU 53415]
MKSRLIAKSINSNGNIYRIGVSREEGGGIFEACFCHLASADGR